MYVVGQAIEYNNGQMGTVVYALEDGHFILQHDYLYAACYYDTTITDEEVWCYVVEDDAWREMLVEALLDIQ